MSCSLLVVVIDRDLFESIAIAGEALARLYVTVAR
jgi:hypothetical protein